MTQVVFIPSVSGGLGHVTRTLTLARALERARPQLRISYVLSELGLRPFNLQAVERTGYPVRILPNPSREHRDAVVREILGEADVVVEDTERRLIAYRRVLPRLRAWISIPMLPIWDELFMDWALLEHADHILYAYPPVMPVPEELAPFEAKLTVTGPILDMANLPSRSAARCRLGLAERERYVTYAPRGFPFGANFGQRVLAGLLGGFLRLRREEPGLRLVLTAVPDPTAIQPRHLPPLSQLDGVQIRGVLPPAEMWDVLAGADLVVAEGTSTLFQAAAVRTPVLMVPGPIYETLLEGDWVQAHGAGVVVRTPAETRGVCMAAKLRDGLDLARAAARSERLHRLVGTDGLEHAVAAVLRTIDAGVRVET